MLLVSALNLVPSVAVRVFLYCILVFTCVLCLFRYKSLCPDTWPNWQGKLSDGVATLVKYLGYKPEEYKLGRSATQYLSVYYCIVKWLSQII